MYTVFQSPLSRFTCWIVFIVVLVGVFAGSQALIVQFAVGTCRGKGSIRVVLACMDYHRLVTALSFVVLKEGLVVRVELRIVEAVI